MRGIDAGNLSFELFRQRTTLKFERWRNEAVFDGPRFIRQENCTGKRIVREVGSRCLGALER